VVDRWEYESKDCRLLQGGEKNYRFLVAVVRYEISAYLSNFIEKYMNDPRYKIVAKAAAYENSILEEFFQTAQTSYKTFHPGFNKKGYAFHGRVVFAVERKEELQFLVSRWINFTNVTLSFCVVPAEQAGRFARKQSELAEKHKNGHPPDDCQMIVFLAGGFTDRIKIYFNPENEEIRQECKGFYQDLITKYDLGNG